MLDAGMQLKGKAHISRVLGRPQKSPNLLWSIAAAALVAGAFSFYFWPSAPGTEQLGRLTILSSCDARTPGQAWLEARSAVGADGAELTSAQRRDAMAYLLGSNATGGCDDPGSDNNNGEAGTFSESN